MKYLISLSLIPQQLLAMIRRRRDSQRAHHARVGKLTIYHDDLVALLESVLPVKPKPGLCRLGIRLHAFSISLVEPPLQELGPDPMTLIVR